MRRIRKVRKLQENNARLRYLSAEECQTLIAACDPHLRPVVVTAINTGMRREEILSLEWEKHIDLKHGFILLDRTKNGDRREIPINRTLRETLQALPRRIDSPYVFADREGNRFKDLLHSFKSACRRVGIKDFRFHDLRHTFASRLLMSGADIVAVKELLGHILAVRPPRPIPQGRRHLLVGRRSKPTSGAKLYKNYTDGRYGERAIG